jgi:succinyl-CoA synthetase beta subunit
VARLFEYQSKILLKQAGIRVPEGDVASSPAEARTIAERIGRPVVLKIQVWVTGRAKIGGIRFAENPQEAESVSREMFGLKVKNFTVDKVLVEERLAVKSEFFAGLVIDDAAKAPVLIFSSVGGTGVEEIAGRHPEKIGKLTIDVRTGLQEFQARNLIRRSGLGGSLSVDLADFLTKLYRVARTYEARSAEVNPLVLTDAGQVYAADCHLVIDDYAVSRHPELGIEIAREFDRPPTELEKIAYKVEEKDHRGTFYFLQMTETVGPADNTIGFHGAGGGGSMMSMDAVLRHGFQLANYCDTSGNPPASKVYRAAKIILSQPNIKGYLASGSGVASQEQYHSARGLVKAFEEEGVKIPAVIRLGGNFEEKAIEILKTYLGDRGFKVEGYGRDDSPDSCAERLEKLIKDNDNLPHRMKPLAEPDHPAGSFRFDTLTGSLSLDHRLCPPCKTKGCVEACTPRILKLDEAGMPVLAIAREEAKKGKCTECLACEIFCKFHELDAILIRLPIPGLKDYRERTLHGHSGE